MFIKREGKTKKKIPFAYVPRNKHFRKPKGLQMKRDIVRRTGSTAGYIYTYAPDHPKAFGKNTHNEGYYYKHIVMMEKKLGRYLHPWETVKFRDGNRYNCTLDNLYIAYIIPYKTMWRDYIWHILYIITKDMFCDRKTILKHLREGYSFFDKFGDRQIMNLIEMCLKNLIAQGYIKTRRVGRRAEFYPTNKGVKKAFEEVNKGTVQKVVIKNDTVKVQRKRNTRLNLSFLQRKSETDS